MATFSKKLSQRITKLTSPKCRSQATQQMDADGDDEVFDKSENDGPPGPNTDKAKDTVKTRNTAKNSTTTGIKLDKSDKIPQKSDKQATGGKVDKMACHVCKTEGHKLLACCEICENWFCGKCQHLKMDAMKLLHNVKTIHWFCTSCTEVGVNAISNDQLDETVPAAHQQRLVVEKNKAVTSLQDTVKMAEEKLQISYSDMVKKLDSNLQKISEANPGPHEGRPTTSDLRELQERQEKSKTW